MLPSLDSILTIASLEPQLSELQPDSSRKRLLSFPLGSQGNALLPLQSISEILRINLSEILPVPQFPTCVLGVYNWRGYMLWLIDLDLLVGYPSPLQQEVKLTQPIIIVVQIEEFYAGLLVRSVNDIEERDLKQMLPVNSNLVSSRLLPYISGYFPAGSVVLNLKAIAQSPMWRKPMTTGF